MKKVGLTIIFLVIAGVVVFFVTRNNKETTQLDQMEPRSEAYYDYLEARCDDAAIVDKSCCLSSLHAMRAGGHVLATKNQEVPGYQCPEGETWNANRCPDSYTWCMSAK